MWIRHVARSTFVFRRPPDRAAYSNENPFWREISKKGLCVGLCRIATRDASAHPACLLALHRGDCVEDVLGVQVVAPGDHHLPNGTVLPWRKADEMTTWNQTRI